MADSNRDLQERRVILSEQREERFQRTQDRRERRSYPSPGRAASAVTQRSGTYSGKGMLAAELVVGFALIAIRLVGDFTVQEDGTVKQNVLQPAKHYGPIAVLAGLLGSFFILSFVAAGGGTRAKLAVIFGGIIILSLGVNTLPEIEKISSTFGNIGTIKVPPPSGTLPDIYGNAGTGSESESTAQAVAGAASGLLGAPATSIATSVASNPTTAAVGADIGAGQQAAASLSEANPGQAGATIANSGLAGIGETIGNAINNALHNLGF